MITKQELDKYENLRTEVIDLIKSAGFTDQETVKIELKYMNFFRDLVEAANAVPDLILVPAPAPAPAPAAVIAQSQIF